MKILIATDGSEFSRRAIENVCKDKGLWADVSIRVVSVYEPQVPVATEAFALSAAYYQDLDDIARERACKDAEEGVAILKTCFPNCSIDTLVEVGRPAQVIVETARSWQPDLIVVGSHGRGFWGRLGLGSVSDAVIHEAPCSVLVAKAASAAGVL